MGFTLALNTNPLVNRFAAPDDLIETVTGGIGIGHLQLTHEYIDPGWPATLRRRQTRALTAALRRTGARVTSVMTGPYGRLNHFGHPDADMRRHYLNWFCALADSAAELGARAIGTQFAILTSRDQADPARREERIRTAIECWAGLAEHARAAGLDYLFWEPMSVAREFGHTIPACRALDARLSGAGLALPLLMMVDIDHGDVSSPDPADTDPYAWAAAFPQRSPIIHVKQSSMNKGGHWPFTAEHNREGRITPQKLLDAIRAGGGHDNEICLELSFREREPTDSRVVEMIRESVAFWAPFTDTGLPRAPAEEGKKP